MTLLKAPKNDPLSYGTVFFEHNRRQGTKISVLAKDGFIKD